MDAPSDRSPGSPSPVSDAPGQAALGVDAGGASGPPVPPRPAEPVQRWRLTIRRAADAPVLAQREQQLAWESGVLASGLPVAVGEGALPRPRVVSAAPLAQGMASDGELVEVYLTRRCPIWSVREALLGVLPAGHTLLGLDDVWLGEPALPGRVIGADYEVDLPAEVGAVAGSLDGAVASLLAADTLPRQRAKGDRTVAYDLRPFVDSVDVVPGLGGRAGLRMRLRHDAEKGIGRPEEVVAELADRLGLPLDDARIRRTGLVLAEPKGVGKAAAPTPGPRGPRRPR